LKGKIPLADDFSGEISGCHLLKTIQIGGNSIRFVDWFSVHMLGDSEGPGIQPDLG
jgi:hypothetical protein